MLYKLAKLCAIMAVSSDAMRMKDTNGACSRGNDPGCSANKAGTDEHHLRGTTTHRSSAKLTKIQQLSTSMASAKWSYGKLAIGFSLCLMLVWILVFVGLLAYHYMCSENKTCGQAAVIAWTLGNRAPQFCTNCCKEYFGNALKAKWLISRSELSMSLVNSRWGLTSVQDWFQSYMVFFPLKKSFPRWSFHSGEGPWWSFRSWQGRVVTESD